MYDLPRPTSTADQALVRRIDELHPEYPFVGLRMLRRQLQREGVQVGGRHVATLMQRMSIQALAPQPGTSNASRATRSTRTCCASWRSPPEACHAREVIEQAFARWGMPEMVNTDQGSQFTATEFTEVALAQGCQLSMDWRGARRDNVFVGSLTYLPPSANIWMRFARGSTSM